MYGICIYIYIYVYIYTYISVPSMLLKTQKLSPYRFWRYENITQGKINVLFKLILSAFCVKCQKFMLNTMRHFFKNSDILSLTNIQRTVTNKKCKSS